jgi:voltage-gated potassium channel Kch
MELRTATTGSRPRTIFDSLTRSFGSVLVLLVLAYWVSEAFGTGRWRALPLVAMVYLSIIIALRIINPSRVRRHLVIMGFALAVGVIAAAIDSQGLMGVPLMLSLLYGFYGVALILPYVLSQRIVTLSVILGAICVYVFIGNVFATIYGFGAAVDPGVFDPPQDASATTTGFGYFSFVTLTTLGYGDITPAAAWIRSVAVVEALVGQIFLVVLVARLVGMHIAQRSADEPRPDQGVDQLESGQGP